MQLAFTHCKACLCSTLAVILPFLQLVGQLDTAAQILCITMLSETHAVSYWQVWKTHGLSGLSRHKKLHVKVLSGAILTCLQCLCSEPCDASESMQHKLEAGRQAAFTAYLTLVAVHIMGNSLDNWKRQKISFPCWTGIGLGVIRCLKKSPRLLSHRVRRPQGWVHMSCRLSQNRLLLPQ